jgi:hypothetical protein
MTKPIISGPYRTFRRLNDYESFIEFEGSTITIPMRMREEKGPWLTDEIKLKAFMRLEVFPSYINNLGTREFQFIIRDWDLNGTSPALNQLFFQDPRGRLTEVGGKLDYVPATVTFDVSNNFEIGINAIQDREVDPYRIFGPGRDLEIRNLSSHHFRVWAQNSERDMAWLYSQPDQRIYWEIWPSGTLMQRGLRNSLGVPEAGPVVLFHKRRPYIDARPALPDWTTADRSRYLLAVAQFGAAGPGMSFIAVLPRTQRGFEANVVQLPGNSVISSFQRQREPLRIHWRFSQAVGNTDALDAVVKDITKTTDQPLRGWIRLVSPSRSLGTADQAPDVGDPIDSADFPARITYAINYNIHLNRERFVEDQAGIAIAVGADQIPPRDVTVAFDKPHLGHVIGRYLEFDRGHCTGMHEITEVEYKSGLNFCRYWRTVPLDPTDNAAWAAFADYDPDHQY